MRVIKSPYVSLLHRVFEHDNDCFLSASCLLFCELGPQARLLAEGDLWGQIPSVLGSDAVLDLCMPKRKGEFLVWGAACAPGGAPVRAMHVRAQVGDLAKTLYVIGDRHWNGSVPTEPQPFSIMPISWRNAFGGAGIASNPLGMGARPSSGAGLKSGDQWRLPNIEMPGQLIALPGDTPEPAGFAPYDIAWPQRASSAGTYDASWFKETFPGFARDMRWELFNAAPRDQQLEGFWRGDEKVFVENMHPEHDVLRGNLPAARPRLFLEQSTLGGLAFREVGLRLDTVWLFPGIQRVVLIFHGMARIEDDEALDVQHLLACCERLESGESIAFYEHALRERLDPDKCDRFILDPSDLTPADLVAVPPENESKSGRVAEAEEGLLAKRMRKQAEQERERARSRISEMGLDPDVFLPSVPPLPSTTRTEDLAEASAVLEVEAERHQAEGEAARSGRERELVRLCKELEISPDAFLERAPTGPPTFSAEDELRRLKSLVSEHRKHGPGLEALEEMVSAPEFEKRIRDAESSLRAVYRQSAHLQDPAPRLQGSDAESARSRVEAAIRSGSSLAGWDLTGADLRSVAFEQASLRGALLENANLFQADLSGCDLSGAVLAHANLGQAKLDGAKLHQANLGRARLGSASLCHADLSEAICYQAVLSGARLCGAELAQADFTEAIVDDADLSEAHAPGMTFCKTSLVGMKAAGADLSESNFLEVEFHRIDFARATLRKATFVGCRAEGVVLEHAQMSQVVMTSGCAFAGVSARGANLTDANLSGTDLSGSNLGSAILDGADMGECKLVGANLSRVTARESRWGRADLTDANLRASNLMNASFTKAVLKGANFRDCNLYGADLARVEVDQRTDLSGANTTRVRVQPVRSRRAT